MMNILHMKYAVEVARLGSLNKAAETLLIAQPNISRSIKELEASLGLSPAKLNRDGNHDVKIGFVEPRKDGGSNAKLANILEYGRHGQPAKPFLKPAKTQSKSAAISAMQQKFEEEVEKR